MNLNKKVGKTTLLNLIIEGLVLIMGALFLFMYLGEFVFVEGNVIGFNIHGGSTGNALIFRDEPIGGLLAAWILGLVAVIGILALLALNFLKGVKLPKLAVPCGLALIGIILLVNGILAFCTTSLVGGGSLGVAAVFAGIFGIVGFAAAGLAAFFTFKE